MENNKKLDNLRHSTAHLLAAAVRSIWPNAKNAIGPSIENGFYQDFDLGNTKITDSDFPKIEEKMHEIASKWHEFNVTEVSVEQAKKDFDWNPYKLELIEEFGGKGKKITENDPGNFLDLCKGGHVENPSQNLKHFKLLSIAGAYWRGSEKNPMLTRIYGTAFPTQKELDEYLEMMEEAKKRDHKKLGRELDLFFFHETSPGMAYWLPKGFTVYNTLYNFAREMYQKYGYQEAATPMLNKKELFETSGHWQHYRDDMFIAPMSFLTGDSKDPYDGSEVFGVKPMNCPNAMTIFGITTRSYHNLPLRLADTSLLHRYELSGTLNGLFRTRQFRQDDAHIFIAPNQVEEEFKKIIEMVREMYEPFDLTYKLRFGTRPEKALGEKSDWDFTEKTLREALKVSDLEYFEVEGEGAFYGPKVDILMKDSLNREWQTGTIQLDIQQPKRFGLEYTDNEGNSQMPYVFHRAIYGSFERFLGILIEHYAGKLPVWLAPVQVAVLPVSDKVADFAKEIAQEFEKSNIKIELNLSNETIGSKIREATLQKIPYMCIIGEKEKAESDSVGKIMVAVRTQNGENLGLLELPSFIQRIVNEIETKK